MKAIGIAAALLIGMALLFVPAAEGSPSARMAIGDLGTPRAGMPAIGDALSRELERSGARLTSSSRAEYIVTGAVTRFDQDRTHRRLSVECEVSLMVRDHRGDIRFVLNGRAAGRGAPTRQLRASVVRAAVRGAIRNLHAGIASE